ncbi:prolactin regulatory element-binding protein-like [Acanthaster planci]|uniref:Prolactin regulatory element-binding protein-like n=1 Tax=Acanthaster planci TaxID=133434 RepID=A0A8B7YCR3_ACAPL|nr:prolactin regulatory element-binding protein-like [Acanthaster planci]
MATHLADLDFPPYVIKCVDETHFLVAGGGGHARTGVPNFIEIFELQRRGRRLFADSKLQYDTDVGEDRAAIMNAALRFDGKEYLLAAGKDEKCQFYKFVKTKEAMKEGEEEPKPNQTSNNGNDTGSTRKRKKAKEAKQTADSNKSKESTTKSEKTSSQEPAVVVTKFDLERLGSVQTDFTDGDKYQKAVCFSPNGMFFATGGADGHVRMWSYPSFEKQYEIKAHSKEVDDIIINPLGNRLVSVSRDSTAIVWKTVDGSKMCDLKWDGVKAEQTTSYRVRCCRFGFIDSDPSKSNMYTIHIPRIQGKTKSSYLTRWNAIKYTPEKTVCTGTDVLSALNISHSGNLVGLGTMSGSIGVYISFSLQKLRVVKDVHGIFVTGLCFVPMTRTTRDLLGDLETAVLSVSADKKVSIVALEPPMEFPAWLMFVGAFLLIILIFTGLAALGLSF